MRFENRAPWSAGLLRTSIGNGTMAGSVLMRVLYAIEGQTLRPLDEPLPCPAEGEETIFGIFEPDTPYDKRGVDLIVVGHVYPPSPPAIATTATVRVQAPRGQPWTRSVAVFGDRRWRRQGRQWTVTGPEPFARMEISLARAFGGSAEREDMRIEYPLNPNGVGFYISEEQAEGQPLPNFEELDQRIATWNDAPDPAGLGFCPYELGMRARDSVTAREGEPPSFDLVKLLSSAFPRMVAPPIGFGQWIQLEHFTPNGALAFPVPDPGMVVRMKIGSKTAERPLKVEQIGIAPDLGRAFVTYRYPFRYQLRSGEERSCLLVPAAESLPASA
ncbi:DUF2169 domain-containing protein [Paraliomyxa miuraensis]|uniref:DUF2169 domain-containing protein n=1 Tax=Paraliomyxa miuraensis TaxID=376150 RepID=UPI00224E757C|nr:DUF2169 domain-containing protein [Paraliomyxa miuraensis]MCX4240632.1 DUF2169 domain-containing protein [Paraliomyxa miuraensis]